MWLEVGETEDSMEEAVWKDQDVAGDRKDRGMYD